MTYLCINFVRALHFPGLDQIFHQLLQRIDRVKPRPLLQVHFVNHRIIWFYRSPFNLWVIHVTANGGVGVDHFLSFQENLLSSTTKID